MSSYSQFGKRVPVIGCVCCAFLLISLFFSITGWVGAKALATVLVILALSLSVHMVRGTASLEGIRVWNSPGLTVFWCMAALNLLATVMTLLMKNPDNALTKAMTVAMVLISMPIFFCTYFIYIQLRFCRHDRVFSVAAVVLPVLGGIYAVLRILNDAALSAGEKAALPGVLRFAVEHNNKLSILIYILSFVCFLLFRRFLVNSEGQPAQKYAAGMEASDASEETEEEEAGEADPA